jgi:KUP system potassium uptake protein
MNRSPSRASSTQPEKDRLLKASFAALGIVYGDIGTSPIYALRECFDESHHIDPTAANVLGVLSLIFWSLLLVVSLKYLLVIMRADNRGEGGVAVLVALLNPWRAERWTGRYWLMVMGLFGAALLYGDASITPAISVLSAVEGLEVATPALEPFVIPITIAILIGIFRLQHRGTAGISAIFSPIILLWFLSLAALGVYGITHHPDVLRAADPRYAVAFFAENRFAGFTVLGSVFLVVTGGEALYADMGHFGLAPIRLAWFTVVLPALLLNYFGQGALILETPAAAGDPFYQLAPGWGIYPLIGIATLATIIASQAVISGVFSLTRQLIQLGQLPRMTVDHTSSEEEGQIYLPLVNWLTMLATIALVIGFRSSSALASAYGIAVSITMLMTTILAFFVARRFNWNPMLASLLLVLFVCIDVAFLSANLLKVQGGGWYPLAVAGVLFTIMTTWARGRTLLAELWGRMSSPMESLVDWLEQDPPPYRIPGTAVFFTPERQIPAYALRHLGRHRVLQERVILLTVLTTDEPRVPANERLTMIGIGRNIDYLIVRYGFMQDPNIPLALRLAQRLGLEIDLDDLTYYVGRGTPVPSDDGRGMMYWRERIFAFLTRNAQRATAFYRLPPDDVVELGFQVPI